MTDGRLVRVVAHIVGHAASRDAVVSSETACDACVFLVGVSGAGLTLLNGEGRGETRYATNDVATFLEESHFTLGEGPTQDMFQAAMPVLVSDLDSAANHERWPIFTPAALRAGVRAMFAFPLRTGAVRLGALVLHRLQPGSLTSDQIADALVSADVILSLLLDELSMAGTGPAQLVEDGFLLSRADIHQATGMLSVQLGVTIEEALVRLRAYAFAHDRPIAEVARDVVARRLRLERPREPDVS